MAVKVPKGYVLISVHTERSEQLAVAKGLLESR